MTVTTQNRAEAGEAGCLTNVARAGLGYSATLALSWNARYELTSVSEDGDIVETYEDDALGRRTSVSNSTGKEVFLVHAGPHVVADVNASGALQRSYTFAGGVDNILAMTTGYGTASTNRYYFLTDHLGTVHAVTDSSGDIVESYRYDAWGRVLGVYDGNGVPLEESAIGNHYLHQGCWYSWQSGLYFHRARWRDPVVGKWISPDPIRIAGGLNQRAFVGNDPVNRRDCFGLCEGAQKRSGVPPAYPWDVSGDDFWDWLRAWSSHGRQDLGIHYYGSRALSYVVGGDIAFRIGLAVEAYQATMDPIGSPVDESDIVADWLGSHRYPMPADIDLWPEYDQPPRKYPSPTPVLEEQPPQWRNVYRRVGHGIPPTEW